MAITKARKDKLLASYTELIGQSRAIFMTDYTGMDVKSMEELRKEMRGVNGVMQVTKNTLLKLALESNDKPIPEDIFKGQIATGFALSEAPSVAKVLVDFAKKEEKLTLTGGIIGTDVLTVKQIEALANLPSLDQLRAQIIGLISAPAQGIASTIASGVRQVINVVDAYAKSEESEAAAEAA